MAIATAALEQKLEEQQLLADAATRSAAELGRRLERVQGELAIASAAGGGASSPELGARLSAAQGAAAAAAQDTAELREEHLETLASMQRAHSVAIEQVNAVQMQARGALAAQHATTRDEQLDLIDALRAQIEEDAAMNEELATVAEEEAQSAAAAHAAALAVALAEAEQRFAARAKKEARNAVRMAVAAQAQKYRTEAAKLRAASTTSDDALAAEVDALRDELAAAHADIDALRVNSAADLEALQESSQAEIAELRGEYEAQLRDQSPGDSLVEATDCAAIGSSATLTLRQQKRQVKAERLVTLSMLKSLVEVMTRAQDEKDVGACKAKLTQMIDSPKRTMASVYAKVFAQLNCQLLQLLLLHSARADVVVAYQAAAKESGPAAAAKPRKTTDAPKDAAEIWRLNAALAEMTAQMRAMEDDARSMASARRSTGDGGGESSGASAGASPPLSSSLALHTISCALALALAHTRAHTHGHDDRVCISHLHVKSHPQLVEGGMSSASWRRRSSWSKKNAS